MSVSFATWGILTAAGGLLLWHATRQSHLQTMMDSIRDEDVAERLIPQTSVRNPKIKTRRVAAWIIGAVVFFSLRVGMSGEFTGACLAAGAIGAIVGELWWRTSERRQKARAIRALDFYIPTVMERVVMAVGAGLDIVPAMVEAADDSDDPASTILRQVVAHINSGLSLEEALRLASAGSDSSALKHACVHLALAYRQGGELVRPLKELSDSTQIQYQETIEEEIARLPVQAVLPLVVTFTGLIICFITIPLVQVSSIAAKVSHVAER